MNNMNTVAQPGSIRPTAFDRGLVATAIGSYAAETVLSQGSLASYVVGSLGVAATFILAKRLDHVEAANRPEIPPLHALDLSGQL